MKTEIQSFKINIGNAGCSYPIESQTDYEKIKQSFEAEVYFDSKQNANAMLPKKEDYFLVPFRLLTATVIGANSYKATDFSDVGVLKMSMNKLIGKPIYTNHDIGEVENCIGIIQSVSWQDQYIDSNGITIPAGINGILAIDCKIAPDVARNVYSGGVYSNSVTIEFEWRPSHEFSGEYDFERLLGSIVEGRMVTRKVTSIIQYYETSLVFLGADPFAKKIDETGELVNVDTTSIYNGTGDVIETTVGKNEKSENNFLKVLMTFDNSIMNEKSKFLDTFKKVEIATEKTSPAHDFISESLKTLNLSEDKLASECLVVKKEDYLKTQSKAEFLESENLSLQKENNNQLDLISSLQKEKENKEKEISTLQSKIENLESLAKVGENYISEKRNEAISLYKKAAGDKFDESLVDLFNKADDNQINALLKQYTSTATSKFSGRCSDCGSKNFVFQSSFIKDEQLSKEDNKKNPNLNELFHLFS